MKQHPQQRRGLRTRPRGDNAGRHLQGNNNKDNKASETPAPTLAPTMSPTKKTEAPKVVQGSVSLGWSLLDFDKKKNQSLSVEELKHWITQDFLCLQDNIWLTSDLETLDSDCQSTIRRSLQQTNSNLEDRTILLNDPMVMDTKKTLMDFKRTEYTLWNIEYPIYSYADPSDEKGTFEVLLQDVLNEEIQEESLVWEDGLLAVVGDETRVFSSTSHYWKTDDNYAIVEWGPISVTPLQALGAIIIVAQTISLILLHFFVKPCLKDHSREKKRKEMEMLVNQQHKFSAAAAAGTHLSAHLGTSSRRPSSHSDRKRQSSRTKNYTQRDFIPHDISIPDKPQRTSGSSAAYPIPY